MLQLGFILSLPVSNDLGWHFKERVRALGGCVWEGEYSPPFLSIPLKINVNLKEIGNLVHCICDSIVGTRWIYYYYWWLPSPRQFVSRALCDRDAGPRLRSSYSRSVVTTAGLCPHAAHACRVMPPGARLREGGRRLDGTALAWFNQRAVQEVYKALG
jgi:hypothetical protein